MDSNLPTGPRCPTMNSYKRGSVFVRAFGGEVSTLSFGFLPPNDNNFVFIFWMIFTLENNAWRAGIKFYKKPFVFQALPFRMVGNDICISTIQCTSEFYEGYSTEVCFKALIWLMVSFSGPPLVSVMCNVLMLLNCRSPWSDCTSVKQPLTVRKELTTMKHILA